MMVILFIAAYFATINLLAFALMGIDKRKAIKGAFRIPEATLFIIAVIGGSLGSIIGGSIGSIAGMYTFRHKTRHFKFVYGMPAILFVQILLLILLFNAPFNLITM